MKPRQDDTDDPILSEIRKTKLDLARRLAEAEDLEREHVGATGEKHWLDFGDLFDHTLTLGDQFSTGFPTVDKFTDGGLARATVCTIQGKPGIGKTLVATQIARALGRHCAVAALYADEGLTGARVRLGQQLGVDRKRMRRPDDFARATACKALDDQVRFWRFLQPRSRTATIEFMAREFDRIAPEGLPRVWLIDSAQVVKCESNASDTKRPRREQISEVVWRVRDLASEYKAIALLVSQVNRGSYSKKKREEQTEDLAAGSETSAIEYASELILHIDGNPKEKIEIRCPKNRYTGDTFSAWCTVDFPTATYHEIDAVTAEAERATQDDAKRLQSVAKAREGIVKELKKASAGLSRRALREVVTGRPGTIDAAVQELYDAGVIYHEPSTQRAGVEVWRLSHGDSKS